MNGIVIALVGAFLCFAGIRSLNLAVFASGAGLTWLLMDAFGGAGLTILLVALAGGVAAVLLARFVFRSALFVIGMVVGAAIGGRLYTLLEPTGGSGLVATANVVAAAFLGGWLSQKWRLKVLVVLTALGGAGLVLSGVGRVADVLNWLSEPNTPTGRVVGLLIWLVLAACGWAAQRQVLAKRLARREGAPRPA